jgi:hypothetical protein
LKDSAVAELIPSNHAEPLNIAEADNAVWALVDEIRWFKGLVRSFEPAGADEMRIDGLTTSVDAGDAYVIVYAPA